MSGAQTPTFSEAQRNVLFNPLAVPQAQELQNKLAGQQIDISNANMEQVSRVSAALLNEPDLAKRAELYPRYVGMLQSQGYAMHAPPTLPDEGTLQMLARQGVSSEKQFEYGAGRTAAQGALGALGIGSTGTGTTGTPGSTTGATAAPSLTIPARGTGGPGASASAPTAWLPYFEEASKATGVPVDLLIAQARQESGFNPNATGQAGEIGAFQIKPSTAQSPGFGIAGVDPASITGPDNVRNNIMFGAQYLKARMGGGDPTNPAVQAAGLHAYNGGGDPNYVQNVFRYRPTLSPSDPNAAVTSYTPPSAGTATAAGTPPAAPAGGVAARAGGTDTAGPAAGSTPPPGSTAAPDASWDLPGAPAPDQPPPPATTAAPPPATTTAPAQAPQTLPAPQVPLEPMLQLQPSGLTAQQEAAAKVAFSQPMTPAQATALTAHYQQLAAANVTANHTAAQTNFERQRQAQADVRQAQNDALAQQEKAKADAIAAENLRLSQESGGRDTERLKLAQAEAAVKAKQAAQPYQGQDLGAQDTNVLMNADPKSREYAVAYQRMAAPHYNQDGSVVYPNLSAFQKPGYVPPGASEPPDYGAAKVTPPTILTQDQARAGTYADRMVESNAIMSKLDSAALDYVQKGLSKVGGTIGFGMNSSDYQRVKQAQENFVNSALRLESGAVISEDEFKKASQQYFPQPGDSAAVIAQKKANREAEITGFVREAGPGYKPKAPETAAVPTVKSADDYAAIKPGEQYPRPRRQHSQEAINGEPMGQRSGRAACAGGDAMGERSGCAAVNTRRATAARYNRNRRRHRRSAHPRLEFWSR